MSVSKVRRHVLHSDAHDFVGRIFDLAMPVELAVDTYEQMEKFPDCLYVFRVHRTLSSLVDRVESLNLVGRMLWAERLPKRFSEFPVSRFDWLNMIVDAFLMRFISTTDCALLLANEIFEYALQPRECTIGKMRRVGLPSAALSAIEDLLSAQGDLRDERNSRCHHGYERPLTADDITFRLVSQFEHWGRAMKGHDRHGREIDLDRFFGEALNDLRKDFNASTRRLVKGLDAFYGVARKEFEARFSPKFRARSKIST